MKPQPLNEVLDDVDEMLGNFEDVRDTPHGPAPNSYMELRRALREARAPEVARAGALVQALKIACAALHNVPEIDGAYRADHKTAHAYALATAQAAVGMAEGAPFHPRGTELVVVLNSARDALEFLMTRAEFRKNDGPAFANAELALVALTRLVGPGAIERKIARFAAAYAGEDVTPADVEMYSHHD